MLNLSYQQVLKKSNACQAGSSLPPPDLGRSSWSGGWRVPLWTDKSVVLIVLIIGMSSRVCVTGHVKDPSDRKE